MQVSKTNSGGRGIELNLNSFVALFTKRDYFLLTTVGRVLP